MADDEYRAPFRPWALRLRSWQLGFGVPVLGPGGSGRFWAQRATRTKWRLHGPTTYYTPHRYDDRDNFGTLGRVYNFPSDKLFPQWWEPGSSLHAPAPPTLRERLGLKVRELPWKNRGVLYWSGNPRRSIFTP